MSEKIPMQTRGEQVFFLPAERSGLHSVDRVIHDASHESVHNQRVDFLREIQDDEQKGVADYLAFLRRLDLFVKQESSFLDLAQNIQEHMLKGSYVVQDHQVFFKNERGMSFYLHASSSTAKSLFGLVFYLTYLATPGQYLIVEKPELHLHPENHRRMAKILAEIANRGIHVILSTNSDYIVKEFNNLLILSKSFTHREELMNLYGYEESQILIADDVSPYAFVEDKIVPMVIDPEEGIIAETFDKVINGQNESSDAIYFAQQERFG